MEAPRSDLEFEVPGPIDAWKHACSITIEINAFEQRFAHARRLLSVS